MITKPIDEENELQKTLEWSKFKDEEVDLERKLICTIDEIKKLKKKNLLLEEPLEESKGKNHKYGEKDGNIITSLEIQVEKVKKIEEVLTSQIKENEMEETSEMEEK